MKPKISIIVPVYKVEQYIHKCINSILTQSFTDFELILVNDGSPDNCGVICEEYAKTDRRIKVIHKENGGLASARNAGLDIAKGDFVGFVDSDDWVESDMYELLYNLCIEHEGDVACCTSMIHYSHKTLITGKHQLIFHNRNEAMKAMLEGELYDEVVWTKLIKRNLIGDIRFPVGMTYEDTAFTYKIIHKCKKLCSIGEPKYHYLKRDNSMMDNAIKNIKIDAILIYDEMFCFINQNYQELSGLVTLKLANSALVILNLIASSGRFKENEQKYFKVTNILNKYFSRTIKLDEYPKNVKILLIAIKIYPLLYKLIINNLLKWRSA
ncbi:glycosyltransferase [Neobacillus drentensis]|uniref:glycosyltransferase family 2 protein n=1 Tax=Neobacillus drentensis TaxID=220684 RepID=UPI0030016382